jgi:hypothetical protein
MRDFGVKKLQETEPVCLVVLEVSVIKVSVVEQKNAFPFDYVIMPLSDVEVSCEIEKATDSLPCLIIVDLTLVEAIFVGNCSKFFK